jgi:type IV secretory pathway VirB10-like protein
MRELETTPKAAQVPVPRPAAKPAPPPPPPDESAPPEVEPAPVKTDIDMTLDTQALDATSGVDVELESGPEPGAAGLSKNVLYEMDQALDNTRSMFTDVDRFIALGRTENAISLLQFQVHKDPKDRDSWIKLMAVYRQEKMDTDFEKTARDFKRHFPSESIPGT